MLRADLWAPSQIYWLKISWDGIRESAVAISTLVIEIQGSTGTQWKSMLNEVEMTKSPWHGRERTPEAQ